MSESDKFNEEIKARVVFLITQIIYIRIPLWFNYYQL